MHGLHAAGIDPLLVDLPGHGETPEQDRAVSLGDVLDTVDRATSDLERFDVVGYSMGGRLALHVALQRPGRVRRLVLESASPGLARPAERAERRASDEALADRIERDGIETFVDAWGSLPLFDSQRTLPAETRDRVRRVRLRSRPGALAAALRGLGTGALPSLWARLAELRCPVLLVVGGLDTKFVRIAREMAGELADVQDVTVADAGHTVHLEAPHEWLSAVVPFLVADSEV